jgi:hypothetical protein
MYSCTSCQYLRQKYPTSDPDYYKCVCPKLDIDPRTGSTREENCTKIREGRIPELTQTDGNCSGYLRKLSLKEHFKVLLKDIFK